MYEFVWNGVAWFVAIVVLLTIAVVAYKFLKSLFKLGTWAAIGTAMAGVVAVIVIGSIFLLPALGIDAIAEVQKSNIEMPGVADSGFFQNPATDVEAPPAPGQ